MGYAMAKNLRARIPAEDVLIIQDINTAATKQFVEEAGIQKIKVADTVRQVAEEAETIITALPEPQHVKAVYSAMLDPPTLLTSTSIQSPRLFIDSSTIDITTSAEVAALAQGSKQGIFIDAPMSGGVVGAQAGTLSFMVGCEPEHLERASAVLMMMGKRVLHLGRQGAGLKGKLANNYLLALNNLATAEAMNMGVQWGLEPKALANMINLSTGKCWPSEVNNPVPGVVEAAPSSRGYEGGFGVGLANKDLKLALKDAHEAGVKIVLGDVAKQLYDAVEKDEKCKGRDFSVVYRYLGGKE
ncbi:3-hydroxyisobutyrate dehydrogenase mitochondrial precursor [Eremomyces bilateralis CBS 781.70]|uniref:3-hydroxyisobutyrate dehydrogenase n=1 Tax=Eremomyces bilateralis CBS 781.70 TaxID=1392243 RepID=A0A6G1FXS3_9PEZI|nr:3-hydroxyisobutyrate dehydrogenase mitochondrial precursor [Eremomyces bilateralis CBS 781.70]KAF1810399.1 3-hydroxyisobutyrate dehydrogenase mitochondrial precursor [Eremomyces bilateralis CBS 781.70]